MIEVIGEPTWSALQNRLGLDDVWLRIFYVPFEIIARRVVYIGIDKETIDGILEGIGEAAIFMGETVKRFNRVFIDGVGDGIPMLIGRGGNSFRNIQSGRIQQYLLFTALFLIAIGAFFVAQAL